MSVELKEMDFSDINACVGLIREGFADAAEKYRFTSLNNPAHGAFITAERLLNEKENGTLFFYAVSDGQPVGFFGVDLRENEAILERITVLPRYQRQGIGASLLKSAKAVASSHGRTRMTAGIIADNEPLRRWYERNGFSVIREYPHPTLSFTIGLLGCRLDGAEEEPCLS